MPIRALPVFSLVLLACSAWATSTVAEQKYPDVIAVSVRSGGSGTYNFDVTISSPYDSPQRYADGFHVTGADGTSYGERTLWHDHASEQPFTRDLYSVSIPGSVREVTVQARDQTYGYGGSEVLVRLPE